MKHTLDLMVQRTYGVMTNGADLNPAVRIHGLPRRACQPDRETLQSLHLALARVPGSLAVATLVTCAIFATATGIVGAIVTLMGLLALPAMTRAGYDMKLSAGGNHGRRLPGHPDPTIRNVDRLRRHGRRVGGETVRRRFFPASCSPSSTSST